MVGAFPDEKGALILVAVRLRHGTATKWVTKRYLQMNRLAEVRSIAELRPRVHLVISLLKSLLMGTHQGAVSHKHLDYSLNEFTFRFNRRKSMNRGRLFYRLVQQAVAIEPVPLDKILDPDKKQNRKLPPRKAPGREAKTDLLAIQVTGS